MNRRLQYSLCLIRLPVTAAAVRWFWKNTNVVPRHLVILPVTVFPVRVSAYCRRNRWHRNRAFIIYSDSWACQYLIICCDCTKSLFGNNFKCVFCSRLYTIEAIADDVDIDWFCNIAKANHCLDSLLPLLSHVHTTSDLKDNNKWTAKCDSEMHKKSFVPRCLFRYIIHMWSLVLYSFLFYTLYYNVLSTACMYVWYVWY